MHTGLHVPVRLAAVACMAGLLSGAAFSQGADDAKPVTKRWGPLTYTVRPAPEGSDSAPKARVEIRDANGRILASLSDAMVADTALREINGGGRPELVVSMFSGGLHCCFTNVVFTQDGGFHRLLDLPGGQVESIAGVKDLNRDGRPEIIVYDNNTWAYYGDLAFAVSPYMPLIIGWNGARYVNQTRKFPQHSLETAGKYQADLLSNLRKGTQSDRSELLRAAALGYYANMLAVGRGTAAQAWLKRRAPLETRQWLAQHDRDIRSTIARWSRDTFSPKR